MFALIYTLLFSEKGYVPALVEVRGSLRFRHIRT